MCAPGCARPMHFKASRFTHPPTPLYLLNSVPALYCATMLHSLLICICIARGLYNMACQMTNNEVACGITLFSQKENLRPGEARTPTHTLALKIKSTLQAPSGIGTTPNATVL